MAVLVIAHSELAEEIAAVTLGFELPGRRLIVVVEERSHQIYLPGILGVSDLDESHIRRRSVAPVLDIDLDIVLLVAVQIKRLGVLGKIH